MPQLPGALPQRPHICVIGVDEPADFDTGGAVRLSERSVLGEPQSGQAGRSVAADSLNDRISFSNLDLHFTQVYS